MRRIFFTKHFNYINVYNLHMANPIIFALEFIVGLVILVKGCDIFIDGASGIATKLGISEHLIGLTIVALATSLPELAVSSIASINQEAGIAIGNIIGSNISNICLILGIAALIMTLKTEKQTIEDAFFMIVVTIIFIALIAVDQTLNRYDAVLFLLLYIYFIYRLYRTHKKKNAHLSIKKESILRETLFVILGASGLIFGAHFLVESGVGIAQLLGVSPVIIGLTMIALGTSLPELSSTITAALKKRYGLAVGNVIGSNIINILLVLGISGLINPIPIGKKVFITAPFLIGVSILTLFFIRGKIGRKQGYILVFLYGFFIIITTMI
jgi:cation:H+ antiporter